MKTTEIVNLHTGFKTNFIIGSIFIPILFASVVFAIYPLYLLGLIGVFILSVWTGIMKIKSKSVIHGILIIILGSQTYGIWPYIVAIINNKKYQKMIKN